MRKTWKPILAAALAASLLLGAAAVPVSAAAPETSEARAVLDYILGGGNIFEDKQAQASLINLLSNFLLNDVLLRAISMFIPRMPGTPALKDFDLDTYPGFLKGHAAFLDTPAAGAAWKLGYDKKSILPADFGPGTPVKYARGSYVPWGYVSEVWQDEEGETEFYGVRTIVMDDGSGRGAVSFSSVDCIGLANADVRKIRAAVADFAAKNNIVSVNVSATHTHSGIDSQGVWTKPLRTLANNVLSALTFGLIGIKSGVDDTYLQTIIDQTTASIKAAHANMAKGKLTYAAKDCSQYVGDRTPPFAYDGNLYRLMFQPDDTAKKSTVIASLACHPESASYGDEMPGIGSSKITADCVCYMEKVINKAGSDFIFIQGNVGTVTSRRGQSNDGIPNQSSHAEAMRFGYELGYILLGMDKTKAQCKSLNDATGDLLGVNKPENDRENYTVWYKDWVPVECAEVAPVLNIAHKQLLTEVQNNMAKILAKAALANIAMIYDCKTLKYYTVTEVGYMELGSAVKVFLSPGEIYGELLTGDASMAGFPYKPLRELYGENLIIFDLMNDAAGYIEPDNEYVIVGYRYNAEKDELESDSWALLVSMGKNAASDIIGAFIELAEGVR